MNKKSFLILGFCLAMQYSVPAQKLGAGKIKTNNNTSGTAAKGSSGGNTSGNIINQVVGAVTGNSGTSGSGSGLALSNTEIVNGLKEALTQGATNGTTKVSAVDGFLKNAAIKILMPPEAQAAEAKLRSMGLGPQCDKIILTLNRAAEDASKEAKPIFIDAIKRITIQDGLTILKGGNSAATDFLKKGTEQQLIAAFKPVIQRSLNKTQATYYWKDVFSRYNMLPFVTPVTTDLAGYVTGKGVNGIFYEIAKEELRIRQDPVARTTDLLKKVFSGLVH